MITVKPLITGFSNCIFIKMVEEELSEEQVEALNAERMNRFTVAITKDLMEVRMYPLVGVKAGGLVTYEEVIEACVRESVKVPIDENLVRQQFLEVNPQEVTIARGTRPKEGKDGYVEYKFDMSAKPQFIADPKDEKKTIDYKNSMQVTLVNEGDILAIVVPPSDGEAGEDVRGFPIAAKPGTKARYFIGEGLQEKDGQVIVTTPGTPSVQDDVLMVRRNYILSGDVDLSTGNINFPGTVIIHGSITDGFEVVAEENVVVNGLISGAKVKAKGYVKCAGGIQGKDRTDITAGSFVAATFINASTIVAEGDVVVTKDVLHSHLSCLGELRLGGSLIGGVTTAFKGVDCGGTLGSETGAKTVINIRTHYRQEKAKELANSVLAEANGILERYKVWVKLESLNEADTKKLMEDMATLPILMQKRQMFDNNVAKFDQMVFENKAAKAKVLGFLEADVIIASPYSRYTATVPIKGPLAVSENNEYQKMAVMKGAKVYGDIGKN
ncbi:MAG: FapA family protein [Candidatus Fibromonas sp.]|nr:FapA family protein [Candidatus Fibromonas sp.]